MAGNDTITTATQNLVVAFNTVNKTIQYISGQFTSDAYPAGSSVGAFRIYHGRSRVVSVNVLTAGGDIKLYDSSELTITPASSLKYALDSSATVGRYDVGTEFKNGIILVISGGSEATITYSVY